MSDLISRADAIEAVCGKCSTETRMECALNGYFCCDRRELEALPSAEAEPKITKVRKDGTLFVTVLDAEKVKKVFVNDLQGFCNTFCEEPKQDDDSDYDSLVPDEFKTEPKRNCTANFVAEMLDRLRNMTDEERWDFFIKFFSPSADIPTEDYSDLPDIPRAYYERIVGNMSHEINMLKEQLESADAEPIVIRAKTFMRKEDFDKWAEDIKKQNKSIVCIPCDAEVVSADRPSGEWIEKGGELVCSVCGNSVSFSRTPKGWVLGKFCQSCGARMIPYKGGDDE